MSITKENKYLKSKQFIINSKGNSNLIFNQNKRADCALSSTYALKSKPINREYNIMLLKKNKRNFHSQDVIFQKQSKSMQMPPQVNPNSQINVINLMTYSLAATPKLKSNYCKRITLTNVDKYYELCLKKVKAISNVSYYKQCDSQQVKQVRPISSMKRRLANNDQSSNKYQQNTNQSFQVSKDLKRSNSCEPNFTNQKNSKQKIPINPQQQNQQNKGLVKGNSVVDQSENCIKSQVCSRNQRQQARNIYSSSVWRSNSPSNRRYLKSSQHNRVNFDRSKVRKGQFVIDAWESTDNLGDDIF